MVSMCLPGATSSLRGAISRRTSADVCAHTLRLPASIALAVAAETDLAMNSRRFIRSSPLLGALRTARAVMRPIEAPADNPFYDEVIGARRGADSYTEINLPVRRHVQINRREELLLLIVERIKTTQRSIGGIVFEAAGDVFVEVVTEFGAWRKGYALMHGLSVKRPLESGIHREIPSTYCFINNG